MKKNIFFLLASPFMLSTAIADTAISINIDNPDDLHIQVEGKGFYVERNPGGSSDILSYFDNVKDANKGAPIRFIVDGVLDETIVNGTGCSYGLIVSKHDGFHLQGNGEGCSYKKGNYTPINSPVVRFLNDTSDSVKVITFVNDKIISSDYKPGIAPNGINMYTGDSGAWKTANVRYGDKIDSKVYFGSGIVGDKFVMCPSLASLTESKTYRITDNSCEFFEEGVVLNGSNELSSDQAGNGETAFDIVYKTPESDGDYYIAVLNKERTKFGSYRKVPAGFEGQIRVPVHKNWFPAGGSFTIGVTKNFSAPKDVKWIGSTVDVSTVAGSSAGGNTNISSSISLVSKQ